MENPGLERFSSVPDGPYLQWDGKSGLKVVSRRTAVAPGPQTLNQDSPISNPLLMAPTMKQDLETPPPPTGVRTPQPASAANGVPAAVNPGAEAARLTRQRMPGGGSTGENPAWAAAHQTIQERLQTRRAHPLHQAALVDKYIDEENNLRHFRDTDIRPPHRTWSDQAMIKIKPAVPTAHDDLGLDSQHRPGNGCETCWLEDSEELPDLAEHEKHPEDYGHEFKPFPREPNERFSAFDRARGEWLYDINDPDYFLDDAAPSVDEYTAQPMVDLKDDHPYDTPYGQTLLDEHNTIEPHSERWRKDHIYRENDAVRARHREASWEDNPAAKRGEIVQRGGDEENNLTTFIDPAFRPGMWGTHSDQPMVDFKHDFIPEDEEQIIEPGWSYPEGGHTCETCYLKYGDEQSPAGEEHEEMFGHPYKPLRMEPGQRFSAAEPNHDDPIFPFRGWGEGEPEDTVDEHNLQEGDDTFRPHHPLVDRVMNQLQGLPDVSRHHPMMDKVNEILDQGPEEGSDALAGGLNTIFDSMRETEGMPHEERLQRAKDAIDAGIAANKISHQEHVKRLRADWEARGGRKTGEPVPVERFSPRYTHPDGQYLVPDPGNPFPQSTSVIRSAGKCKGCGRQTFADDEGEFSDPRGPLGEYTNEPMRAADYDMHGPDLPACANCMNESDRYHSILDKGKGHKAGEPSGGFHWQWERQPDGSQKNVRIDHTHYKDKKGLWHQPGEKPGSCPDCGPGEDIKTQAGWAASLRAKTAETDEEFWARQPDVDPEWYGTGMHNPGPACETCYLNDEGEVRPDEHNDRTRGHEFKPFERAQRFSATRHQAETDEEFWARMEREHPGQQNTSPLLHSPDQAGEEFVDPEDEYRDPELDWDHDDLDIPENMSLRDHAHLLRSGVFKWNGRTRYPSYTHQIPRTVVMADGARGHADEGHVIEHNTGRPQPHLPSDDQDAHVLEYPWSHTYYPAGHTDEQGWTKGYNSPDQAMYAANTLAIWGPHHSNSKGILSGYKRIGDEASYDPAMIEHNYGRG